MEAVRPQIIQESTISAYDGDVPSSPSIYSPGYLHASETPVTSWRYRYVKRTFDLLFGASMVLCFIVPGCLIALAIKLTSRGPIFFREMRIGCGGEPFQIWKFRSMYYEASHFAEVAGTHPDGSVFHWRMRKHLEDPRITPIGSVLRRWSLDELPQLFNVLRGDMSLIGPRPIVAAETVLYRDLLSCYLAARPGLSGLWQVSGRSNVDYAKRAKLDAEYVTKWSLRTDIGIFIRTVPAVLRRVGAR